MFLERSTFSVCFKVVGVVVCCAILAITFLDLVLTRSDAVVGEKAYTYTSDFYYTNNMINLRTYLDDKTNSYLV